MPARDRHKDRWIVRASLAGLVGVLCFLAIFSVVTRRSVAKAHALGAPVLAWTVDDPGELERVVEAGVDGVITNDPRIFAAVRT